MHKAGEVILQRQPDLAIKRQGVDGGGHKSINGPTTDRLFEGEETAEGRQVYGTHMRKEDDLMSQRQRLAEELEEREKAKAFQKWTKHQSSMVPREQV